MNSKRFMIITIAVAVIAVVAIIILNKQIKQADQENAIDQHPVIDNQPTMGEEDAAVSIIEFGDYKCPSCKLWSAEILPQLEKDYIKDGQAKFSYINVLFHGDESVMAALASESVFKHDPEEFWAFHEALFTAQPTDQQHDETWVTTDMLIGIAEEATPNMDIEQLRKDIEEQGTADEVNADTKLVKKHNITSSPSIIINGVLVDNPFKYEEITKLIEKGLK